MNVAKIVATIGLVSVAHGLWLLPRARAQQAEPEQSEVSEPADADAAAEAAAAEAQASDAASADAASAEAAPADAQAVEPPVTRAGDDIVVTAQKRKQRVQEVPLSITVASEFQLERLQVNSVADLSRIAASLEINSAPEQSLGGGGSIRGLGTQTFSAGASSSVGVVVDQVPQGNVNISDLFDVASVEVLKGPQGTLFGLTTSAGVINIVTGVPDPSELSARLRTELSAPDFAGSRFGRQIVQGLLNVPLAENAAVRIAGNLNVGQGVNRNALDDSWDHKLSYGLRAHLLWQPTTPLTLNVIADYGRQDDDGADFFIMTRPQAMTAGILQACGIDVATNVQSYCSDRPFVTRAHSFGGSAQLDYDFGPLTATSISAYRGRVRGPDQQDIFRLSPEPLQIFVGPQTSDSGLFTQELRVASPTGSRFEYTAGVFFSRFQNNQDAAAFNLGINTPVGFMLMMPPSRINPSRLVVDTQIAAFGQSTIHVVEHFNLIAGLRLTHEQLALDQNFVGGQTTHAQDSPTNFSFKGGAQYEFDRDLVAYATVSRGYKGPQISVADDPTVPTVLARPEIPMAYELGLKGSVLGHAINYDLNAFYIHLQDFQSQECHPGAGGALICTLTNISPVTSQGIEADLNGTPMHGLSYHAGLIYNPVLYPSGYRDTVGRDLGSAQVAFAPRWKATLSAEYGTEVTSGIEAFIGADAVFKSQLRLNTAADTFQMYGQHWIVGGRLGVRSSDETWTAALFVRNLLDEHEPVLIYSDYPGMGEYGSLFTPQSFRQVGVSLDVRM